MSQQDMANAIRHNFPDIHKQKPSETELHLGVQHGPEKTTLGTPGQLGGFAFDVATAGLGGGIGSKVANPIAEHMMTKAIAPTTRLSVREAEDITKTALEQGISVTKGGVQKLNGMLRDLGSQVDKIIKPSTKTIPASDILKELKTPEARAEFRKLRLQFKGADIPIQAAQEFKQMISRRLSQTAYQDLKESGMTALTEGRKQLQSVLRGKIAELEPAVKDLNQKMHELYNLRIPLQKSVVRNMKKLLGSAPLSVGARATKAAGEATGAAAGLAAGEIGQRVLSETPDR
jgi:hypothetical protein